MKLAIVGGRDFNDRQLMYKEVDDFLECYGKIDLIISGGARGADTLVYELANKMSIKFQEVLPDWAEHGKKAGILRNKIIVDQCDLLIAFWNGVSAGTHNSIMEAEKQGKLCKVVKY